MYAYTYIPTQVSLLTIPHSNEVMKSHKKKNNIITYDVLYVIAFMSAKEQYYSTLNPTKNFTKFLSRQ